MVPNGCCIGLYMVLVDLNNEYSSFPSFLNMFPWSLGWFNKVDAVGGQAIGTGHLWQLVHGGGLPGQKDLQLVQRVLSLVKGGVYERKMTSPLVTLKRYQVQLTLANCTSLMIYKTISQCSGCKELG